MKEPWWLQYLKSLFLEIPIVTIQSVFQNQVTIFDVVLYISWTTQRGKQTASGFTNINGNFNLSHLSCKK